MPTEALSAVEMNAVDRQILNAERGRRQRVELDARTARMLYAGAAKANDGDLVAEVERLKERVKELEEENAALNSDVQSKEDALERVRDALAA